MSGKTNIRWSQMVWNPVLGCTKLSEGCRNCYAMGEAWRKQHHPNPKIQAAYKGLTEKRNGRPEWTNIVRCLPERLDDPTRRKIPTMFFVNSMADLFHDSVAFEFIDKVISTMTVCTQHIFQVLTKRPERMRAYSDRVAASRPGDTVYGAVFDHINDLQGGIASWPLPNLHLGVSVEGPETLHRLNALQGMPNAVPWVSLEPLLGAVDIGPYLGFLKWVVVGGESGLRARPMQPDWARTARDACAKAGVPFFHKQNGEFMPDGHGGMMRVGNKRAGHVLDGRTHDEWPEVLKNWKPKL